MPDVSRIETYLLALTGSARSRAAGHVPLGLRDLPHDQSRDVTRTLADIQSHLARADEAITTRRREGTLTARGLAQTAHEKTRELQRLAETFGGRLTRMTQRRDGLREEAERSVRASRLPQMSEGERLAVQREIRDRIIAARQPQPVVDALYLEAVSKGDEVAALALERAPQVPGLVPPLISPEARQRAQDIRVAQSPVRDEVQTLDAVIRIYEHAAALLRLDIADFVARHGATEESPEDAGA